MILKTLIIYFAWIYLVYGTEDKARYDNYRVYRVHLKIDEQVKIFQELEAKSDGYIFIGHARKCNQYLIILVAAHKIATLTDILKSNEFDYKVLVSYY